MLECISKWKNKTDESFRIIAFGSSNTELSLANGGYHSWTEWLDIGMRMSIGRHACVINRGIVGETSSNLLDRISRDVISFTPAIVIITVGGNDIFKGLSINQYRENLIKICGMISNTGGQPMLQTYYCPVYHLSQDLGFKAKFESYMDVNRQLSDSLGLTLLDQYTHFLKLYEEDPLAYAGLMRDWMHPGNLGNFIIAQNILKTFGLNTLPAPAYMKAQAEGLPPLFKQYFN